MKRYAFLTVLLTSIISGCSSDSASYLVNGDREKAFTLFREKPHPGADWELSLALTHLPDCQRRHPLKRAPGDQPYQAELFADAEAEGYYLLHSGRTWYEAQLGGCTLKEIEPVTGSPGTLAGTWKERDGEFKFSPAAN